MASEWYFKAGSHEHGPFSSKQLRKLAAEGRVTPDSPLRRGRAARWFPAGKVEGLFPDTQPPPSKASDTRPRGASESGGPGSVSASAVQLSDITSAPSVASPPPRRPPPQSPPAYRPLLWAGLGAAAMLLIAVGGFLLFGRQDTAGPTLAESGALGEPQREAASEDRQDPPSERILTTVSASGNVVQPASQLTPAGAASVSDALDGQAAEAAALQQRGEAAELNVADLIELAEPAVVRIDVTTRSGSGVGSGFVVSKEGLVVTNYHVIEGATGAVVRFRDGALSEVKGTLFIDPERDIAVIEINVAPLGDVPVLAIAPKLPRKGDRVVALGAPKGLSFSVTEGMISGVRKGSDLVRDLGVQSGLEDDLPGTWIQTTTPISPGNSGGPLVNLRGEVVGANTFMLREAQNLNFAISASDISDAVQQARNATMKSFAELPRTAAGRTSGRSAELDAELSAAARDFLNEVAAERTRRHSEIDKLDATLEKEQETLKQAMLAGDEPAQRQARHRISEIVDQINGLVAKPLSISVSTLDVARLKTGEFGNFDGLRFDVLQVLDSESGIALVTPITKRGRGKTLLVRGIELSSVVDDDVLNVPSTLLFEVAGTQTYETALGGTNTVFVVSCVGNTNDLTDQGLVARRRSRYVEPSFTDEERAQIESIRNDEAQRVWAELQGRLAKGMTTQLRVKLKEFASHYRGQPQATAAENELKAASQLHVAQQLIKVGSTESGESKLRLLIDSWPETISAKEARKLLGIDEPASEQ
jgi:S1-C subfamily serine protease